MNIEQLKINEEKGKNSQDENICLENFDFDKLILKSQKQFIKDLIKVPSFAKKLFVLGINIDDIDDSKFNELLDNGPLKNILGPEFEAGIEETYEEIANLINEGIRPVITVEPRFLPSLISNGLKIESHKNTYDKQVLIAGTIGREPLNPDERIICRINNISLDDITPRSTGEAKKNNSFNFNGVIIFNKNIKPSDIEIISMPKFLLPPNIELPVTADKLKQDQF